jgi:hypothetical protein
MVDDEGSLAVVYEIKLKRPEVVVGFYGYP